MPDDDRSQHDFSDPATDGPFVVAEPVRWPEPSPLAHWWQQILFGDRRSA
ncbi:hypothetical protein Rhow_008086 [Rhodococcus wratislaviensis]|uniref:Uncharacterized protein n=1 Tax=Rhodococcus wratislaviensis TaxID=44752 RepID=A0A402CJP9_RHOWR|nr:hypothetical protein [Rhodococcus wratislaviensis]GCE43788.1 hypothetical protein Rhow_008086 [Rhodococcus wratislaviensis]